MTVLLSLASVDVARGRKRVLADISLDVSAGEVIGLLGPNGAGKSTLLRVALGLIPRASGRVSLGGLDPALADRRALAKLAALLPERAGSGSGLSVRDVVATGRFAHTSGLGAETSADHAAIDEAITSLAIGSLTARAFDSLSAGERKRVLLARCFAQSAPLLVLDEPTSTLDPGHARALFDAVRTRARGGHAALVAIHDLALAAAVCDRLVVLREGRAVAIGTPAQVLAGSVVQDLFGTRAHVEIDDSEIRIRVPRG